MPSQNNAAVLRCKRVNGIPECVITRLFCKRARWLAETWKNPAHRPALYGNMSLTSWVRKKLIKVSVAEVWAEELLLSRETLRMINGRLRNRDNLKDLQTGRSGKKYFKLFIIADVKAETTYFYDSIDFGTCARSPLLSIQQLVSTNMWRFAIHSHLCEENQESLEWSLS